MATQNSKIQKINHTILSFIKKKHISPFNSFIRFKNGGGELNYNITEWALPFSIEWTKYLVFFRFLCVSVIIKR